MATHLQRSVKPLRRPRAWINYHQPNSSKMDLDSMKLTHGGIWKQIQVKEKKKNQSSKAPWLVRYRPPWIISKKEDPGHSKNCRKAAKKVF